MRNLGKRNKHLASLILALASLTSLLVLAGYAANRLSPHNFQRGSAPTAIAAVLPQLPVCPGSIAAVTTTPFGNSAQVGLPCFPRSQTFSVASGRTTPTCLPIPDCFISVTVYDVCLQDDTTHDVLLINSVTGHYKFTECSATASPAPDKKTTFEGKGTIKRKGNCFTDKETITLSEPRVNATIIRHCSTADCLGSGSAKVSVSGKNFQITDKSVCNNTCACDSGTTAVTVAGTGTFNGTCKYFSGVFNFNANAVFKKEKDEFVFLPGVSTASTTLYQVGGADISTPTPITLLCGSMAPDETRVELRGSFGGFGSSTYLVVIEGIPNRHIGVMDSFKAGCYEKDEKVCP